MAFTSWADLKTTILDDLADGSILTKSYSIGNRQRLFRDLNEVKKFLQFCDMMIGAASGARTAYASFNRPGSGL